MEDTIRKLKALSDPTRFRIMMLLLQEELCVCELESVLGMEQSRISHGLRTLRDANLIEERRDGRWVFHRAAEGLSSTLSIYLEESAKGNQDILADREKMVSLLGSEKPQGKRCPTRDK
jgi:ArsR family transcriptional regulator